MFAHLIKWLIEGRGTISLSLFLFYLNLLIMLFKDLNPNYPIFVFDKSETSVEDIKTMISNLTNTINTNNDGQI